MILEQPCAQCFPVETLSESNHILLKNKTFKYQNKQFSYGHFYIMICVTLVIIFYVLFQCDFNYRHTLF